MPNCAANSCGGGASKKRANNYVRVESCSPASLRVCVRVYVCVRVCVRLVAICDLCSGFNAKSQLVAGIKHIIYVDLASDAFCVADKNPSPPATGVTSVTKATEGRHDMTQGMRHEANAPN